MSSAAQAQQGAVTKTTGNSTTSQHHATHHAIAASVAASIAASHTGGVPVARLLDNYQAFISIMVSTSLNLLHLKCFSR